MRYLVVSFTKSCYSCHPTRVHNYPFPGFRRQLREIPLAVQFIEHLGILSTNDARLPVFGLGL